MSKNQIKKVIDHKVSMNSREQILALQDIMLDMEDGVNVTTKQDSHFAPLKHSFADGIYIRQMTMVKGAVCIGKIHKHLHAWFLLTGHITVITEGRTEDYIAPCYVVAPPGTKRVIYTHEESIFVNVHKNPDNIKDIDELEKTYIAEDYKEYEEYINKKK